MSKAEMDGTSIAKRLQYRGVGSRTTRIRRAGAEGEAEGGRRKAGGNCERDSASLVLVSRINLEGSKKMWEMHAGGDGPGICMYQRGRAQWIRR